jgi:uncharacterized Zn-finger protein
MEPSELGALLRRFVDAEDEAATQRLQTERESCPSPARFHLAHPRSWTESESEHLRSCPYCQNTIAAMEREARVVRTPELKQGNIFAAPMAAAAAAITRTARVVQALELKPWHAFALPMAAAVLLVTILGVMLGRQNAIIKAQRAELAELAASVKESRDQVASLESKINAIASPGGAESLPLIARIDVALPGGSLGTVEPSLERHSVPARFSAVELNFNNLPETTSRVLEATVEGGPKPIQGREIVVRRQGARISAELRVTRQELGPFVGGTKEISISLSEPGHALLGRVRLLLEQR